MADAEYNRLDKDRPPGAASDRLKLLLKVAAKSEFLTKSRRERKRYPRNALERTLGKKSLRCVRSGTQDVRIHQANPNRPESGAQSEVSHHVCRCRPSATNNISQSHSALVHAHADVEHQQPFKDDY